MYSRAIRGALTVDSDTSDSIKSATVELLTEIIKKNDLDLSKISHAIFTLTNDLKSAFPAKFARECLGFSCVPMMCFNELDVGGSLEKCLRVLIVVNTEKSQEEIRHVYLRGAEVLRKDLSGK